MIKDRARFKPFAVAVSVLRPDRPAPRRRLEEQRHDEALRRLFRGESGDHQTASSNRSEGTPTPGTLQAGQSPSARPAPESARKGTRKAGLVKGPTKPSKDEASGLTPDLGLSGMSL